MQRKKAVADQAREMVAKGGEVWFGDETTLREFPPLRAAWARRGEQAVVVVSMLVVTVSTLYIFRRLGWL